ncbi:MAG: MBL fold metallo-hydrolase [Anaerolineales bacterium]|nr:MBL fold metallo-hydrolase [Anaerolineales bacterium]
MKTGQFLTAAVCLLASAGCLAAAGPDSVPAFTPATAGKLISPPLPRTISSIAAAGAASASETDEPISTSAPSEIPMTPLPQNPLKITILYNNIASDPRLQTDWGFAALVDWQSEILLFDTGGNGAILLGNMQTMEVDPLRIHDVVLSHIHSDHTGGLNAFLEAAARPPVYLLSEFGTSFIQSVKNRTEAVEVIPGMEIAPGIRTTGNAGGKIPEQALMIRTGKGLVVITGCAHPGIVRIVEKAVELTGDPVYLVLGGFHLRDMSDAQMAAILADFRRLGVQKVAPSHCTGERAISLFAAEYGDDFLRTGAGSVLIVE